ncbi:Frequency clock protein [Metarhizium album ARSEF 1941]|uniref:Frequency clock protein n=1 Tax=Metarhizium album (strain ARSEF 1941) TaxID=1081103 RepID=A0A0B2WUK9_METAS|nr:Frequency clock protein [Metarhizium album ARSEF 1941]KHN97182.1 Frequency clock protein [Metarhizium album ARSEF 1941]
MPLQNRKSQGTEPPPPRNATGHPLPRRASPGNSVTLKHHQLARDAFLRASSGSSPAANPSNVTSSPRRNSSGESHETGQSDPKKWFDLSNQNPTATFDNNAMDVDPPFFQKESDESSGDKSYRFQHPPPPRLATGESSSADDYRSVIDDLTVEIQKLKEELKRYKQKGPEMLRKDKLFEIKYHGLPKRRRRELETTLRDFAASIQGSPDASSSQRKKSLRHTTRDHMYSASGSASKHASSCSGSNVRPVDSAYASMSSGANSAGVSLGRPSVGSRVISDQKVENYLRDIPEGFYPRHMVLTDRDRKRLVVRRLEQLFTGKIGGRHARRARQRPTDGSGDVDGVPADVDSQGQPYAAKQQSAPTINTAAASNPEPSREAKILPTEQQQQAGPSCKKSRSRGNGSASNSNGDQTESGGNGNSSGSGTNPSPTQPPVPDQRPTRVKDLDPDRTQVPSENMEYIRHLGLVPPELITESSQNNLDVKPDAEGWVYLNLLCNMAQLHIINVTPSFVRSAVNEISTKFQLSPDGRKIRWRGGQDGTKFSSDSSNESSQRSPGTEDSDSGQRKRQKTGNLTADDVQSGGSSKGRSKFGPQVSASSDSFHYKPLFVHSGSPNGETSLDETLSSFGPIDESNIDDSRWNLSGSGTSNRRKRRHDGAIIYYSGAPFCTDLSGDPGDTSPATYMLSSGQDRQDSQEQSSRPMMYRSTSGSCLGYRPLGEKNRGVDASLSMDVDNSDNTPDLTGDSDSESSSSDMEFPWSCAQQFIEVHPLEPCGLGGVMPDDHFMVVVTTKRPTTETSASDYQLTLARMSDEATDFIIGRLASMSTSSPAPLPTNLQNAHPVEIEYMSGRIKRLAPVPLPPPVIFLPPFSTDMSSSGDDDFGSEDDDDALESSEELMSRAVNPHQSDGYPDGVDLSSGDEDGEEPDEDDAATRIYDRMDTDEGPNFKRPTVSAKRPSISSAEAAPGSVRCRSKSASAVFRTSGSSAATAGGLESGYSSSDEES